MTEDDYETDAAAARRPSLVATLLLAGALATAFFDLYGQTLSPLIERYGGPAVAEHVLPFYEAQVAPALGAAVEEASDRVETALDQTEVDETIAETVEPVTEPVAEAVTGAADEVTGEAAEAADAAGAAGTGAAAGGDAAESAGQEAQPAADPASEPASDPASEPASDPAQPAAETAEARPASPLEPYIGSKLAPVPLATGVMAKATGTPAGDLSALGLPFALHIATGLLFYPIGWLIFRSVQKAIPLINILGWPLTGLAYGAALWAVAIYGLAYTYLGNFAGPDGGFAMNKLAWTALWGHMLYAFVLAMVIEARRKV